nr:uncharacterized protein LOC121131364 [Lepeophtheirus salmonis]
MRKVFKEIFSRYIEEREEVNGTGGDGEDDGDKGSKNKSTSYPIKKKRVPAQAQGGEGNKSSGNGGFQSTSLPSSSHPETFTHHNYHQNTLNPRNPGLVGQHGRGHRGGRGGRGRNGSR